MLNVDYSFGRYKNYMYICIIIKTTSLSINNIINMKEFKFTETKICLVSIDTYIDVCAETEEEAIQKLQDHYKKSEMIEFCEDDDISAVESDYSDFQLVSPEIFDDESTVEVRISDTDTIIYENKIPLINELETNQNKFNFTETRRSFVDIINYISVDAKTEEEAIKKLQEYYENSESKQIDDCEDPDITYIEGDEWIEDLISPENGPTIVVKTDNNSKIIYQNIK